MTAELKLYQQQQALADLEKKEKKAEEAYRDSLKYYNTLQQELRDVSVSLNTTTRASQEAKRLKLELEAASQELDNEFTVMTQTKVEQEKEVRDLENKVEELRQSITIWEGRQQSLQKERVKDRQGVDAERKTVAGETRAVEKRFADEKRELINKMEIAKYQVQKNFNEKLEAHRRRFEKQVEELKRDQKQEYQNYNLSHTLKLENCLEENREWQRKTEEAKETLREVKSNVAKLHKNVRREILNEEVMGMSKIDELNTRSIPAAEKREIRNLEKKIASLRGKTNQTIEQVILCNKQREEIEYELQEQQREAESQDLAYTQLEQSKHAMEERLSDQIAQLEKELVHNTARQVVYDSEIEKFEEILRTVNEEVNNLHDRHAVLQAEMKASKKASDTLGVELIQLLKQESDRVAQLDKEKRATELMCHKLEKQTNEVNEKIQMAVLSVKKQQGLFTQNIEAIDQLKAKNQKLEQASRRLETRV